MRGRVQDGRLSLKAPGGCLAGRHLNWHATAGMKAMLSVHERVCVPGWWKIRLSVPVEAVSNEATECPP